VNHNRKLPDVEINGTVVLQLTKILLRNITMCTVIGLAVCLC
jgi:hypothetical protein